MSTTSEDFRENLEVMKDTLRELSEEERQKYRSELDDENSINLFDKIIEEIVEEEKGNQCDWKTRLKNLATMKEKLNISHLVEQPKQIEEDETFMKDFIALVQGGNVTKEARNALKKEIGTPQTTPPMLTAEIKKMLKKSKGVAAREEKMADLTTLITLAAALLSRNDKKSLEDLAKVLALSLRLTVDLRRKNLFEFFNMSSDKDEQIIWSQDLLSNSEIEKIKEIRKESNLRMIRYNAARVNRSMNNFNYNQRYVYWEKITQDEFVLNIIREGYRIPINRFPKAVKYPEWEKYFSEDIIKLIDNEIERMLKNKIISELDEQEQKNKRYHLNPIFVVHGSKKDRLIVDCRELNKTIDVEKFTFETIDYVASLIYSNKMVMTSIDLSDAYHSIEIHQESRYLLCIKFKNKIYKFNRLVFGLASAPYIFQRILKVPLNIFRESSNVLISSYLDDIILIDEEDKYLSGETKRLCEILINCGFRINETKSVLVPSKKLQHLGYEINQNDNTIQITEKRLTKILNTLDEVYSSKKVTYRKLASLLGNAVSTKFSNENIMLYITPLYNILSYGLNTLNKNYENFVFMDDSEKEMLTRIKQYLGKNRGISIIENKRCEYINIFTDATPEAIGIYVEEFNIKETHRLSPNQKYWHINQIELYAIEVALNTLIKYLQNLGVDTKGYDIISHCDNTTARSWIIRQKSQTEMVQLTVNKIIERMQYNSRYIEPGYNYNFQTFNTPIEYDGNEINDRKRRNARQNYPKPKKTPRK